MNGLRFTANYYCKVISTLLLLTFTWSNFSYPAWCETGNDKKATDEELIQTANEAFWERNYAKAKNICSDLLARNTASASKARLLVNIAICDAQLDNWKLAAKEAKDAISLAEGKENLTCADAWLVCGRDYIVNRKIGDAKECYSNALELEKKELGEWSCNLGHIYEGLAACAIYDKDYPLAAQLYKKVAQLDYLKYGPDDTHLGWSMLSLCNVTHNLNNPDLEQRLYKKVFWNFRRQNEERIVKDLNLDKPEEIAELRRQLYGDTNGYDNREMGLDYIKDGIPADILAKPLLRSHDFNNWYLERVGRETAPGLAFYDPRVKLKGLIVTVHGLGLHHGAFTPFAERVQHNGFGVISFDVRGFGSYRNDEVLQQVNFDGIINDLHHIISELRKDFPGRPIFILGESMGGAIALRLGSLYPDLIDGVVSSVPSGTRFHARSTTLDVGLKLLTGSHKQFNISERVVDRATQDPKLRTTWEEDPQARMHFSAHDLLAFQKFMDDNIEYAKRIKNIPVIIFQGYSDQLVKPLSTLTLYQAIKTRDKDLVFVGRAEHLIFEEGQFDPDIVDGALSWMEKHGKKKNAALQQ